MKQLLFTIRCVFVGAGLLFLLCTAAAAEDTMVILNKSVPDTGISKGDVSKIYLGDQLKWSDNSTIKVAVLKKSKIHKQFLKEYVGRSGSQFKMTWKKLTFTGKGKSPDKMSTVEDMIDFVAQTDGAIGYIPSDSGSPGGVNVVRP